MKSKIEHVVVATDFSSEADKALLYAIELCMASGADLSLLHVLNFDKLGRGEEAIRIIEQKMTSLRRNYLFDNKRVVYRTTYIKIGRNKEDELLAFFREAPIDLLIMGARGEGKTARLLGSTTSFVVHTAQVPVLIVPMHAQYSPIRYITFACHYDEIQQLSELKPLATFANTFQAQLRILHVHPQPVSIPLETAMKALAVENLFEHLPHELDFVREQDPEKGIKQYLERMPTDCLAIKPRKYEKQLWKKIFDKSVTESFIGQLPIPIYAF